MRWAVGQRRDRGVDLLGGQLARGFLEVRVVGAERALELGVVEGEEGAAVAGAGGGDRRPVLLDRGLLQLRVALEAEGLGEAHHRRGRGARSPGQLLGGEEGCLVEVVDDVAGDVFLGARELVETLLDVVGKALELWGLRRGLGHGGPFRRTSPFPFRRFWLDSMRSDDPRTGAAPHQPQHDRLRPAARQRRDRRPRGDPEGARPRRALARRQAPLPPLRPDLAHLRRRPRGRRPPRQRRPTGRRWPGCAGPRSPPTRSGPASPAVSRPGAKLGLRLAGVANVAMAAGFAWMSRR